MAGARFFCAAARPAQEREQVLLMQSMCSAGRPAHGFNNGVHMGSVLGSRLPPPSSVPSPPHSLTSYPSTNPGRSPSWMPPLLLSCLYARCSSSCSLTAPRIRRRLAQEPAFICAKSPPTPPTSRASAPRARTAWQRHRKRYPDARAVSKLHMPRKG
jgi:hypothetical protein